MICRTSDLSYLATCEARGCHERLCAAVMPLAAGAEAEGVQSARVTPGFLLETELQPTDEWLPEILPEPPELAEEPEGWRRIEMQTASSSKLWAYLPRDAILVPSDAATTGVFRI